MSLPEAVAFFYKVKSWKLNVDFPGWTVTSQSIAPFVYYENEKRLACSVSPFSINIAATKQEVQDNGFGAPFTYTRRISSDLTWSLGQQTPVLIDDSYAIKFYDIFDGVQTMEKTDYLTFRATATPGSYYDNPPVPATDSAGYFTISPSEYWPYDPNDGGGPIYDSVTGEQLRPFPS